MATVKKINKAQSGKTIDSLINVVKNKPNTKASTNAGGKYVSEYAHKATPKQVLNMAGARIAEGAKGLKNAVTGKNKNGGKTPAWQRKEGKSPSGGLNAKGRASLKAAGHDIKPPQPGGGPRKKSFCARMSGMKKKLTSSKTANDPNSRINKSLRKWKC